jgi:hypothetical protein
VKASTTLNKSKEFSPKNMLSLDLPDACWNSDQGLPQTVTLDLGRPCHVTEMRISFQGGFVGQACTLLALTSPTGVGTGTNGTKTVSAEDKAEDEGESGGVLLECEPEDSNDEQCFYVSPPSPPAAVTSAAPAVPAESDKGSSVAGGDTSGRVCDSNRAFQYYRVVFEASTDFYGRITIYQLGLYGSECAVCG